MSQRRVSRFAPGLRRELARAGAEREALYLGAEIRSVRGIEALTALTRLHVPTDVRLHPVARLPNLRDLFVFGPLRRAAIRSRTVDLGPLACAPALTSLQIHDARIRGMDALAEVRTLREVDLGFLRRAPPLAALARLPLERLVLDDIDHVRLDPLRGLPVERLDLWGCTFDDGLDALATMPNLREVWVHGAGWAPVTGVLERLAHVGPGARIVLDDTFDPVASRATLRALEDRGVAVFAAADPHEHGVYPSWWTARPPDDAPSRPVRYRSPNWNDAA